MQDKEESIYSISIGSFIDRKIIITYISKKNQYQKNLIIKRYQKLLDKLLLISIGAGERHTEQISSTEKILSIPDNSTRWIFMVYLFKNYPNRIGYKLLNDLMEKSTDDLNTFYLPYIDEDEYTIQNKFKTTSDYIQIYMSELRDKYKDISKIDTAAKLQNEIEDASKTMRNNIDQMLKNLDTTSDIELKSSLLRDKALEFKGSAKKLKNHIWTNRKKVTYTVGGVGITTIVVFIVKFLIKAKLK